MTHQFCRCLMLAGWLVGAWTAPRAASAASPERWTLELSYGGARLQGTPLEWSNSNVVLLTRDGRLMDIDPAQAQEARRASNTFASASAAEMRAALQAELGKQFDVTGTGHYLVAHPKGEKDRWGPRFEEMYRNFVYWIRTRGFTVREPEFPLVALVFPDRAGFEHYYAKDGAPLGSRVLGYYSNATNRVALYDTGGDWQDNVDTVVHEVTHQTAYNTGVHSRFTRNPRWVVEGLGTLFEAPGIWNWRSKKSQSDRLNRERLEGFRRYAKQGRSATALADMVSSDRQFESDPSAAYAQAWALTMYLVETQPNKYTQYLAKLAARPPFQKYSSAERTADFTAVFGANWPIFEAHFARFVDGLK